jgi:hypothetical protein
MCFELRIISCWIIIYVVFWVIDNSGVDYWCSWSMRQNDSQIRKYFTSFAVVFYHFYFFKYGKSGMQLGSRSLISKKPFHWSWKLIFFVRHSILDVNFWQRIVILEAASQSEVQCWGAGAEITNYGSGFFTFIKDLKKVKKYLYSSHKRYIFFKVL